MSGAACHRWNPVAVACRWRLLLWLTPLVALLTSLIWHLLEFRRDAAAGVVAVHSMSSLPAFAGSAPRTAVGEDFSSFSALVHSPGLLGAVADEMELPALWETSTTEAGERLRTLVNCKPIEGTALVEVEVRQSHGVNALRLCRAVLAQAVARHRSANASLIAAELASGAAEIEVTDKEIEIARAKLSEMIRSRGAADPETAAHRTRFEGMQKSHEQLRLGHLAMTMESRVFEAAEIHEEPAWQVTPWSERLRSFAGSAGTLFWGSVCIALGLAYLAEALEPRRATDDPMLLS